MKKRYRELPDEMFDARFKLLKCQRDNMRGVKELYPDYSYRALARQYNISVGTAWMICNPEEYKKIKIRNCIRKQDGRYYVSEKAVEQVKKSRTKLKKLNDTFKAGSKSSNINYET